MLSKKTVYKVIKEYSWIIIGSIITALSINIFLVPFKIAPGGVSGIATVVYYLTNGKLPVGLTMLVLNIPLFISGFKVIGRRFALKTLVSLVLLSLIIDFSEPFTNLFVKQYLIQTNNISTVNDILLYSIFGGFIMGIGLGVVFKAGATTGGSDLAARVVNHFLPNFTMGQVLLFVDTSVIVFAAIAFKSFLLALYAIIALYISSKVIDAILEGVNFAKAVFIISDHSDLIAKKILTDIDRGVTALKGVGKFTGNDKEVLLCVLHRGQLTQLKELVKSIDDKSFIVLADIREVLGEGFQTYE